MLEVKDLYREYRPKKGEPVVALNHVSVKFPDKGLVFILGKSGSGKSTLLNVMGGLDKADGGDIIIKGKSSKNFKQGDFDSYRNTYLGFIFQEYNILDEFNVGQNIALALELQGKKATSEEINRILEEVDLKGYGTRKTNELSGGQKQRVAIARALVKDPDIIFGDEPTGALDSKTGLAVFDTLKKLAEKKLVVVVSHDREFAELYGDRVIELADGKIISDIEKITVAGKKKSEGVTLIDQSVLRIEKDYELTDEDMAIIKEYLNEKSNQERLISLDDSINGAFKRITRIDDFGNKESFKTTDETAIVNKKEEFKTIKSRLSLRKCFRIGGSSLKTKPFRLVITILLSITAFAMFGLADTMGSYNKISSTTESITEMGGESISLQKIKLYKYNPDSDYFSERVQYSTEEDAKNLSEKYGLDFRGVSRFGESDNAYFNDNYKKEGNDLYNSAYAYYASGMFKSSKQELESLGFELTHGTYPTGVNEVLITKAMYDTFKAFGYKSPSNVNDYISPEQITESNLIGKKLSIYVVDGRTEFKITGIVDTHFDNSKYAKLNEQKNSSMSGQINTAMIRMQFEADYGYGYHSILFTNEETIKQNSDTLINANYNIDNHSGYRAGSIGKAKGIVKLKNGATSLSDNEFALSANSISNMDINIDINEFQMKYNNGDGTFSEGTSTDFKQALQYITNDNLNLIYNYEYANPLKRISGLDYSSYDNYFESLVNHIFDDSTMNKIFQYNIRSNVTLSYNDLRYNQVYLINGETMKFAGIVFTNGNSAYFSDSVINNIEVSNGEYAYLIARNTANSSTIKDIVTENYRQEDGLTTFIIQNAVMPGYRNINDIIEVMSKVFLYVGIGFAVFAALMLFNFITISISYKKREIGILRAVGARSRDVFNIFFAESFIIAMIAFTFAIAITFVVSKVVNNSLVTDIGLQITLLSPGVRQVLLVLGVSVGVAFISTFIPVYKIAMKRPIDAIRDR